MASKRERASSAQALSGRAQPVWVNLTILFPGRHRPRPATDRGRDSEIAPGGLVEWVRTSSGEWLGVVTFHLRYRDGRTDRYLRTGNSRPRTAASSQSGASRDVAAYSWIAAGVSRRTHRSRERAPTGARTGNRSATSELRSNPVRVTMSAMGSW
jgi:hypothetical protein